MPMGLEKCIAERSSRELSACVAGEGDLADLDGGAFLDVEGELDRGGRNGLHLSADDGVLVTVLAEHLLEDDLGALELGGVVLALDGERRPSPS